MKIISAVFKACLLLAVILSLSSCNLDSAVGIDGAEINEKGELILAYSDGTRQNLGVVVGADGKDVERVQRAMLGITVTTSDSRAVYDSQSGLVTIEETVSVYEVGEGSLAEGVLEEGDVLLSASVNGNTVGITRQYHVIDMMLDVRVGDTVIISILRDGAEMDVSITVTEDCLTAY